MVKETNLDPVMTKRPKPKDCVVHVLLGIFRSQQRKQVKDLLEVLVLVAKL